MNKINDIDNFKRFVETRRNQLYENAENADDITLDDEWMQDNQWDEIYLETKSLYE